jgi:four helix bundle protein
MRDFRQIRVWEKAHQLTLEIYKVTAHFPKEELYGLTSQIRRASASIPANIAEGFGRGGNVELARFLQIGMGSAFEVEYHLLLAKDLGLITKEVNDRLEARIIEVKRICRPFVKGKNQTVNSEIGKQRTVHGEQRIVLFRLFTVYCLPEA